MPFSPWGSCGDRPPCREVVGLLWGSGRPGMEHQVPQLPELMTNFRVTQRHRGGLPARGPPRAYILPADSALEDRQVQVSRTAPISAIPVRSPSHGSEGCDWPGGPSVAGRVGSSFPLTPCSGRRGRRFKSGHPDRETAGHKASSGLPFALRVPGCPILGACWERTQVTVGR